MCIGDFDLRDMDVGANAFRDGSDLQRQITQCMELPDTFLANAARSHRAVENTAILPQHIVQRAVKEILIESVDKVLLDKRLEAEHGHLIGIGQPGHTRCVVGHHLGKPGRVLLGMDGLIEIQTEQGIVSNHLTSLLFSLQEV